MVLDTRTGRVPVIVTTTHFSTEICLARSRQAQGAAAMVMVMPPYHGATLRVAEAVAAYARWLPLILFDPGTAVTAMEITLYGRRTWRRRRPPASRETTARW